MSYYVMVFKSYHDCTDRMNGILSGQASEGWRVKSINTYFNPAIGMIEHLVLMERENVEQGT